MRNIHFFFLKEISFFHAHFSFNWPWYVCPDQKHAQDTIIQIFFFYFKSLVTVIFCSLCSYK